MTAGLQAQIFVRRNEEFTLDLELDIAPGSTTALLGPNGSGKSTTVSVLAGLLPVDRGRLRLNERVLDDASADVFVAPENRRIGVVFQQYLLFDHLDVLDNVGFGIAANGASKNKARAAAEQWLERFDLTDRARLRPPELSGGQAQRVALARALAIEPDLLLLDEPLAALDVATKTTLRRVLADHLRSFEGPRLLITHDPTDAFLLADEIHILENGRITQSGTADHLRRHPATPYVAALAGLNLLSGVNSGGQLTISGVVGREWPNAADDVTLQTSDTSTAGAVLITIHPNAIALHPEQPHGSPRNTWQTIVEAIEPLGDVTRVVLGAPLELSADITPAAATALALVPGAVVWVSIKATEIALNPA